MQSVHWSSGQPLARHPAWELPLLTPRIPEILYDQHCKNATPSFHNSWEASHSGYRLESKNFMSRQQSVPSASLQSILMEAPWPGGNHTHASLTQVLLLYFTQEFRVVSMLIFTPSTLYTADVLGSTSHHIMSPKTKN